MQLAQKGYFVKRNSLFNFTLFVCRDHIEGRDIDGLGGVKARGKAVFVEIVQQKADCAFVHAEKRNAQSVIGMQAIEQSAVAADRYNNIGILRAALAIAINKDAAGMRRVVCFCAVKVNVFILMCHTGFILRFSRGACFLFATLRDHLKIVQLKTMYLYQSNYLL